MERQAPFLTRVGKPFAKRRNGLPGEAFAGELQRGYSKRDPKMRPAAKKRRPAMLSPLVLVAVRQSIQTDLHLLRMEIEAEGEME